MIYLDSAATSFEKPPQVYRAVIRAMTTCASPGRGGYEAAMEAQRTVYRCRERAGRMFECQPEQVVFTSNCTHGLNMAIGSLVKPGDRVAISGFEHNAVTRTLHGLQAKPVVAGRKLFDPAHTLQQWETALKSGVSCAVFTHCSNVFGYVLPVEEMAKLCRQHGVPFVIDAAQSAGAEPIHFARWEADFVAMPGHKGLLGPQGTGLLLCKDTPKPLIRGGTGSESAQQQMPDFLPDVGEAGTLNVPGIAGLNAGMAYVEKQGVGAIGARERVLAAQCAEALKAMGYPVFMGESQGAVVSFVSKIDCQELAHRLAGQGICVRSGLHCAPLAHESAGTLDTGTVRISYGCFSRQSHTHALTKALWRWDR